MMVISAFNELNLFPKYTAVIFLIALLSNDLETYLEPSLTSTMELFYENS